jgi:hypothetical protein
VLSHLPGSPHCSVAASCQTQCAPSPQGNDYVNQIGLETDEGSERIKAAYGVNYERLVALKNKYDSTNLFRHNQNIKPTV